MTRDDFAEQAIGTDSGSHARSDEVGNPSPSRHGRDSAKKKRSWVVRKVKGPVIGKLARKIAASQGRSEGTEKSSMPLPGRDPDTRGPSSIMVRKVQVKPYYQAKTASIEASTVEANPSPTIGEGVDAHSKPLIRKHKVGYTRQKEHLNIPATMWPEKQLNLLSRRRALNLKTLPVATTPRDIIVSIDNTVREFDITRRSDRITDIVIKPRSDSAESVDAVVIFLHSDGAQTFYDLAVKRQFKVLGVEPEVSLEDAEDPSKVPQQSEDKAIGELPKLDRREFFSSPEQRRIVRRTSLIYN
ncbi:hypothetical protein Daus18300_012112 [Diaporthe australafricana]|uniref:Uncharacterized protein n=1 Tax=Diaporthe australafricana TaxID=127596 RepID=A0ABR3W471_9PEZI